MSVSRAGDAIAASDTGARLGLALLAYLLGVTLIVTLLPFQFAWPAQWQMTLLLDPVDFVANILLFVPLGFLYRLTRPGKTRFALSVLALGALVSLAIECAQLFETNRNTSIIDVGTNALGAWLGALGSDRIARSARIDGRVIGWLALELPLMCLVYLLVPLLWVNSVAAGGETLRLAMTVLTGVFGAHLLGGIQRHYFGPANVSRAQQTAVFAGLWFIAGAFPLIASRPAVLLSAAGALAAYTCWQGGRAVNVTQANRRFEIVLLKSAAPIYAVYLVLLMIAPLYDRLGAWHIGVGFTDAASMQIEILRLLELVAAFTLVGYMAAEFRGRVESEYREAVARLIRWGVCLALAGELLRGFDADHGASVVRGAMLVAATLYGGWLYHLQREHVVRLLAGAPR